MRDFQIESKMLLRGWRKLQSSGPRHVLLCFKATTRAPVLLVTARNSNGLEVIANRVQSRFIKSEKYQKPISVENYKDIKGLCKKTNALFHDCIKNVKLTLFVTLPVPIAGRSWKYGASIHTYKSSTSVVTGRLNLLIKPITIAK